MNKIQALLSTIKLKWLTGSIFILVFTMLSILIFREWETLVTFPWQISLSDLILTIIFHSLALGITFFVWHLMIARLGDFDNLRANFRFYYISTLAKRIPTPIWYVSGRLMMYQKMNVAAAPVVNCIILEGVIIGIAGIFTFLAFLPFYSQIPQAGVIPFVVIGVSGISSLLIRPQLFIDTTNRILGRWQRRRLEMELHRQDILIWGGLYILPWIFAGFSLYFATRTFIAQSTVGLIDAIGISTLAMLVALLSTVLPSGLGLKELTSGLLLSSWMPFSSALVISIMYRLVQTLNELVWALIVTQAVKIEGEDEIMELS